jgi:hypothetical protein
MTLGPTIVELRWSDAVAKFRARGRTARVLAGRQERIDSTPATVGLPR